MKTLLVLRHAKASPDSASGSDFDRPLTDRGHRASAAVGRHLRVSDRRVDAIVASPARRVLETVAGVVEGARIDIAPRWDRRLYNASLAALFEVVQEIDGAVGTALIVAHNPGLKELIVHLAEDDPAGLRARVGGSFPTGALAELRLAIDDWRNVGPGCGRIIGLVRPEEQVPAAPE